ncbi:hypothetical protein A1O3_01454 [Capronia epimyces CBS 606.96]|uniref:Cyclin-D1-binding protein 1-like N-terminal domain-containing protein n=1 Tax=Capronia epimyces CBS 606.96 TaxID=1182542 RepID=W9YTC0_9EURO|nr:uncharacterized protein A1O3_01454 [Capronia epimyces CBS 606.96]EXJ92900.1 hypothetical protein A1O3_01454 [Capronia epimyces CBS 606.96]
MPPSPSPSKSLATALQTSLVLCERFASSLAPNASVDIPPSESNPDAPSSLSLLNAAATSLRSQATKLSLLSITAPFTPSAVATCLAPLNESILTSLVTAALLTTPEQFTPSFAAECRSIAAAALRDTESVLRLLEKRSQKTNPKAEVTELEKKAFTEATGRVWDDCDKLTALADGGVPGYVVHKSQQWLELMKDAVKELEDWDPEEDIDDEDLFGESLSDDEDDEDDNDNDTDKDDHKHGNPQNNGRAAISAGVKEQALKVLNRIPQSIHVVIKQRLEKMVGSTTAIDKDQITRLDTLLTHHRHISELMDESAEGMYLGDLELCLKKAGEARALTVQVVEAVIRPFTPPDRGGTDVETKEAQYIKRALQWIQQVDPGGVSRPTASESSATKVHE